MLWIKMGRAGSRLAKLTASAFVVVALVGACGGGGDESGAGTRVADGGLTVYVVNYPLQYFAERIGGDRVRVEFPAPADVDPAYWTPDAEDVVAYQGADIILLNGADYAGWVGMVSLPASKLVDTSAGFADRHIGIEGTTTHSHGPEGEHSHGVTAFTTWLDPTLAVMQADAIKSALVAASPENEATFASGFNALQRDLLALDESVANALAVIRAEPLLGSHPVYQYFARRYGLNLRSVHFEPDEVPGEDGWRDLQALLREHPSGWMIWEGEPLPE
ncbi:MAG: metal ABC transporter substrate-binding protein, partial [Gemmatimonadales bacterium]